MWAGRFPYPIGFKTTYLSIPIRVQNLTRETRGSNSDARNKRPTHITCERCANTPFSEENGEMLICIAFSEKNGKNREY
jgi:ribosomal protein L37E